MDPPEAARLFPDTWVAPGAVVSGDVTLGPGANVWFCARVNGDAAPVVLEACANVQDNCVVEGRPGFPAHLGAYVTMGHNASVLGATIEERVLVAIGARVLPGARVGSRSIVAAHATVPEGMQVPPDSLVIGQGRILRQVTPDEVARIDRGGREYQRLAAEYRRTLG